MNWKWPAGLLIRLLPVFCLVGLLLPLTSCKKEKEGPVYRVIGEAFAGPNQLSIRQDLSLRSPVVAQVEHAAKLEVLDRRRRFVQVRTKDQKIGWVDMRLLISAKQMDQLEAMAARYAKAPSMGVASVFDVLNVHIEPSRYSPTFLQVGEKEKVEIIGHRVVERKPYTGEGLDIEVDPEPKKPARKPRKKKEPAITPPPPPPAPTLPFNYAELSRTPKAEEPEEAETASKKGAAPVAPAVMMDDLTLIRTKSGKVGWVLTNALFLEVPDEVAQYAEGKRITSYFPMGDVMSEGEIKKNWLWTTQSVKYAPFEFDGLRLFTYNAKRKRYETAYRERDLRGYFPILTKDVGGGRWEFQTVVEGEGGKLVQRSYAFDGTRVKLLGKADYTPPNDDAAVSARGPIPSVPEPSFLDRLKNFLR